MKHIYQVYIYTRDCIRSPVATMGWVGVGWGGDDDVSCTCKHLCYGMMTFLAHVHIFDALATEIMVGVGWGRDDDVPWTCGYTSLMLRDDDVHGTWGGDGMMTFLAHAIKGHWLVQMQEEISSSGCCSIAQKAWHNVSADCFAVVQKWL